VKTLRCYDSYDAYDAAWQEVARAGYQQLNLDAWAGGRRYLSLATLEVSSSELSQLHAIAVRFGRLLDLAVERILDDADWWPALAWPWPAIELARQEPVHPERRSTLFGRFDCLLERSGLWQVIEYNSDTPSGGREASGFEPSLARRHQRAAPSAGLSRRLVAALLERIAHHPRPVKLVGIVSSHSWLEDMSQATWLAMHLRRAGQPCLVGDVTDLAARGTRITLRGRPIDALYRFYPIERLYRHAIFAPLMDTALDRRLLLLNGLRGFVAQSKACLAWLWTNRDRLPADDRTAVERHLPATLLARDPRARQLVPESVVKHVNGREGDSVVFGAGLAETAWEARLLEGGYVVQRAVDTPAVADVEVDDWQRCLTWVEPRYACVGAFVIGGRFGGCYTRLDGPITSARATYVATLPEPRAARAAR
jgi:glutathionylspermidine synthase